MHRLTISYPLGRMYEIMHMIAKRTEHQTFMGPVRFDGMEVNNSTIRVVNKRIHRKALRALTQQPSYVLSCENDDDFILLKLMLA